MGKLIIAFAIYLSDVKCKDTILSAMYNCVVVLVQRTDHSVRGFSFLFVRGEYLKKLFTEKKTYIYS